MENNVVIACGAGSLEGSSATTESEHSQGQYIYNNYNINITIDSIHLSSSISPFDILKSKPIYNEIDEFGFSSSKEEDITFKVEVDQKDEYSQKYVIYIDATTNIHIKHHFKHKIYTYHFSGLSQYKELNPTLIYILKHIYKSHTTISRIDIALDSFSNYELFNTNPLFKTFNKKSLIDNKTNNKTEYINATYADKKKKFECIIYTKNGFKTNHDFTYNEITRIEVRLENSFLTSRKLKDLLLNADSITKLQATVIDILGDCNITYNNSSSSFEHLKIKEAVYDFINFLESDANEIIYSNYNKFRNEIQKQTEILNTLKSSYRVATVLEVVRMVKSKKLNVYRISKETKLHRQTVTKIIDYYTSHMVNN